MTKNKLSFGGACRKLILAWLVAVLFGYLRLSGEERDLSSLVSLENTSFLLTVIITVTVFLLLCVAGIWVKTEKLERGGILFVFSLIALLSSFASPRGSFWVACTVLGVVFTVFALGGRKGIVKVVSHENFPLSVTVGLGLSLFIFVSLWTVCRVRCFCTPTYDFGLFSQMFYNMSEVGLPLTTLERDGLLSHFAVHVSPIYYLFLPVYYLFPRPETLQILQAGVMASAVIPLWKICKARGLSDWVAMLLCGVLVFFPAFSGGAGYDLHENCFLTALILWVFYGIEKKNSVLIFVFSILTLWVKEDAAVYVCIIGLWLTVSALLKGHKDNRRQLLTGICLTVISVGWFLTVTSYLATKGDGVMTYRYGNFMYDGSSSLMTVIKSVIMNPMKALYECTDGEKLKYIAFTLLPLLGIPLFTRRYERYILLIPYLLFNLMSDYAYQHDLFFQYSFGSIAFLIYLTVLNLSDFKNEKTRILFSVLALAACMGCFFAVVVPKASRYPSMYFENRDHYISVCADLDSVPSEISVAATTFYTTYLSSREVLYDVGYCSSEHLLSAEYIVVDPEDVKSFEKYVRGGEETAFAEFEKLLFENGYEKQITENECVAIYAKDK